MTPVLKNMYKEKLSEIVKKYNNPVHTSIKTELAEIKSNTYFDFPGEYNIKTPKCKVQNHPRMSKYKGYFQKGTHQIGQTKCL